MFFFATVIGQQASGGPDVLEVFKEQVVMAATAFVRIKVMVWLEMDLRL